MTNITIERSAVEQALGALVRAEQMYGQPNQAIQDTLREALEQSTQQEPICKHSLQVWAIPHGKGNGQFSWEPQDELTKRLASRPGKIPRGQ